MLVDQYCKCLPSPCSLAHPHSAVIFLANTREVTVILECCMISGHWHSSQKVPLFYLEDPVVLTITVLLQSLSSTLSSVCWVSKMESQENWIPCEEILLSNGLVISSSKFNLSPYDIILTKYYSNLFLLFLFNFHQTVVYFSNGKSLLTAHHIYEKATEFAITINIHFCITMKFMSYKVAIIPSTTLTTNSLR